MDSNIERCQTAVAPRFLMLLESKLCDRIALSLVITIQVFLFWNFYHREIEWCPPQYFDQTAFLTQAYRLKEDILSKGPGEIGKIALSQGNPSGIALPIEGTLLSLIFDQGRFSLLLVNLIGFAVLQVSVFYTARTVWGHSTYGYLGLGLLLCQTTPWFWAGGLFDFRMDFIAYCLFGVWLCAALRSSLFLDRNWAIITGLLGALLVANRFITSVYLVGICAGFGLICIVTVLLKRVDRELVRKMARRLANIGISLAVLGLIAIPILINSRQAIHAYYVVNHVLNDQKDIRAKELGIQDVLGHLLYYPQSILNDHWGSMFLWAGSITVVGMLIAKLSRRQNSESQVEPRQDKEFPLQIIFLFGAILGPVAALTADVAKSPVVGGIVGVPAVLLLVALIGRIGSLARKSESLGIPNFAFGLSLLILVVGMYNQFTHAYERPFSVQQSNLKKVAELHKWLVEYANQQNWRTPKISFDVISGWFNVGVTTVVGYEQTRKLIEFQPVLGRDIGAVDKTEALSCLAASDFVVLTTMPKKGVYPFHQQISQYWSDLKEWTEKNLVLARSIAFEGFSVSVYVRPEQTSSTPREGVHQ